MPSEDLTRMDKGYDLGQAVAEAGRCLLCHDAPCSKECPAGADPATFIRQLCLRNVTGAARTIKENNILGGICARICPAEMLCAKECVKKDLAEPIDIGGLQQYIMDREREEDALKPMLTKSNGKNVAVIGSGPAGLACAAELAHRGYKATVFEAAEKTGGVLRYGVPSCRLPEDVLDYEVSYIREKLGVEFKLKTRVANLDEILAGNFDAVFLAHGLGEPRKLGIPGENLKGVYNAVDFLARVKYGEKPQIGSRVLVIGGGSVAMDAAIAAKALGAERVFGVCLEDYSEMPATPADKKEALGRGVEYLYRVMPKEIVGSGKVEGFKGVNICWKEPGRFVPANAKETQGTEFEIKKIDSVIVAIGQKAADSFGLEARPGGYLKVDEETGQTSKKGVFAGGDAVRGPALAVEAIADGKKAAEGIDNYLSSRPNEHLGDAKPWRYARPKTDLSVDFCGVKFLNPFMLSSSPVSNSGEMVGRAFDAGWAGVAYKTIVTGTTPIIHPSPRMNPYHYGNKRLIGLQNVEQVSDRSLKDNLLDIMYLKKNWPKHVVMASIMGFESKEWSDLAKACTDAGADMLELNFSCPHMTVEGAGHKVGQADELIQRFTEDVRKVTNIPIVAKMTPNITDMNEPAMYAKKGGADGISAINTIRGISEVGLDDWIPRPNVSGKGAISGYSGPAVKPVGLRFIAEMAQNKNLGLPLSGIGGIETWIDALEYILAGATTIQVTTGVIHYGYRIVQDMIEGLSDYMASKGISRVSDLIGKALPHLHDTGKFDLKRQGASQYDLDRCVGCGLCYIVCRDAGGQALEWDSEDRRPKLTEDKCLSCMICSFICPVEGLITYKEMPPDWKREETPTVGKELE